MKLFRLTDKEVKRADRGYVIVVRPQFGGGFLVATVAVQGREGRPIGKWASRLVDDGEQVSEGVREVARWMDKMAVPGTMGTCSRARNRGR